MTNKKAVENVNETTDEMIKLTVQEICGCKSCVPDYCKSCICSICARKSICEGCDCDVCEDGDMDVFCCNKFQEAAKDEE